MLGRMRRSMRPSMGATTALLFRSFVVASARPLGTPPLHMVFGAAAIPHPEKQAKGGEDAYFFDDRSGSFGVADGVGGSASAKVDPGLFSREMLKRCFRAVSVRAASTDADAADGALVDALRTATAQPLALGGSSTLLVGQLDPSTGLLRMLNLGDSGAMLLRPSYRKFRSGKLLWPRVVLRSHDQQHFFNCPYQASSEDLAQVPSRMDELLAVAREGDIVVAATDGVLDNLFDSAIQLTIARCLPAMMGASEPQASQAALDDLAQALAREANAVGMREDEEGLRTPFQDAAAAEGYRFAGGKLDDVAIVCGLVRSGERPPPRMRSNFGPPAAEEGASEEGGQQEYDGRVVSSSGAAARSEAEAAT